ncbi:MAG: hypothetical protein WCF14_00665, partial [Nitrososphaeraceae archaeon]
VLLNISCIIPRESGSSLSIIEMALDIDLLSPFRMPFTIGNIHFYCGYSVLNTSRVVLRTCDSDIALSF